MHVTDIIGKTSAVARAAVLIMAVAASAGCDSESDAEPNIDAGVTPPAPLTGFDKLYQPLTAEDGEWATFDAWNTSYNMAVGDKDADAVADLYEEGAILLFPSFLSSDALVGRDAIVANNYAPLFQADGSVEHTLEYARISANGNSAIIGGRFTTTQTTSDGTQVFTGDYVLVLTRVAEDAPWRIATDTFVPDPVEPAAVPGLPDLPGLTGHAGL